MRLVELERPAVEAMEALVPDGPYAPHRAAELVAELLRGWLDARARRARASPATSSSSRRAAGRSFSSRSTRSGASTCCWPSSCCPTAGCRDPHRHAPQLLALLDGLMLNQLLQPATELADDGLVEQLERFFATC